MSAISRINAKLVNGIPLTKHEEAIYETRLEREMEKALNVAFPLAKAAEGFDRKAV